MDKTSLAKVCNTFFNKDLSYDYSCGLLEVEDKNSRYNYGPDNNEEVVTCSRSKISKQKKKKKFYFEWFPNRYSQPAFILCISS